MKNKGLLSLITSIALVVVMSGCSFSSDGNKQVLSKMDNKKQTTLKVLFFDEQYFMQRYGYMFMAKYPNIDIEVVSTRNLYNKENKDNKNPYADLIENEKLDVLLLPDNELEKLSQEQLLYDLEPVILQDKFDVENIHPTIIEYLKMKGSGKLYGLSPTFTKDVLFMNQDLFTKLGVQYPEGDLSWKEVMLLAQRFPISGDTQNQIFGFTNGVGQNDPFSLIMKIADENGLMMESEGKAALRTPGWKTIFELVMDAYKTGTIPRSKESDLGTILTQEDWLNRDPFIAGKSAMSLGNPYTIESLTQADRLLKDRKFNWELINAPTGDRSEQTTSFSLNEIFAINAKSPNLREAWELVKYMNGDEMARVHSKTPSDLWSRTTYKNLKDGKSLEPFYQLNFNRNEVSSKNEFASLRYMIRDAANKEIEEIIAKRKSIDQALEAIEVHAQTELDKLKSSQDQETG